MLVEDEALHALWLAGTVSEDEVSILIAFDAAMTPKSEWLSKLGDALPGGVQLIGAFVKGCADSHHRSCLGMCHLRGFQDMAPCRL